MTVTLRICKLCKKSIRSSRFTYDMAKDNIRHIFHRRYYKKRAWQFIPKIINHLKIHILSYINNHFLPVHYLYIYTMFYYILSMEVQGEIHYFDSTFTIPLLTHIF